VSDGGAARDEALVAYVEALEAALRVHRGVEHVLSPREFALAHGWYEAGVPLAAVLVAIDLAFEMDPRTSGLGGLRRRVEELAALGPHPAAASRDSEHSSLPELADRLAELREKLLELPGRFSAQPLAELAGVADLPIRKATLVRIDLARPLSAGTGVVRWLVPPDLLSGDS
jgi:hypothetical protein